MKIIKQLLGLNRAENKPLVGSYKEKEATKLELEQIRRVYARSIQ